MLWLKPRGTGRTAPGADGALGRPRPSRPSGSRLLELAREGPAPLPPPRSVAVLPFVNVTKQPALDALGLAVAQRVYERLSRVSRVVVVAYSGQLSADGDDVHFAHVGRLLRVDAVLLGQVSRRGAGVRATALLLDAIAGAHLWAGCVSSGWRSLRLGARLADAMAQCLWNREPSRP